MCTWGLMACDTQIAVKTPPGRQSPRSAGVSVQEGAEQAAETPESLTGDAANAVPVQAESPSPLARHEDLEDGGVVERDGSSASRTCSTAGQKASVAE